MKNNIYIYRKKTKFVKEKKNKLKGKRRKPNK